MSIEMVHGQMTVEAALRVPLATAQLIRFDWTESCDDIIPEEDAHRLDLSLTPRPRMRVPAIPSTGHFIASTGLETCCLCLRARCSM